MPQVQDQSVGLLNYSPACYHCAMVAPKCIHDHHMLILYTRVHWHYSFFYEDAPNIIIF